MESITKHSATCKRVWRRYDMDCPRCQELAAGATARPGWSRRDSFRADAYCFCPSTPLSANRCPTCGKPPYTD